MNTVIRTCLGISAGAFMAIGAHAQGAASGDLNAPRIIVHYDAASLATERGARTLLHRLQAAAQEVCPQLGEGRMPTAAVVACRKQALTQAVAHVNNERLAALHAERGLG